MVFTGILVHAVLYVPGDEVTSLAFFKGIALARSTNEASLPARLRIPRLSIDAAVQRVGLAKSGNMAVPTNYSDVGWYRLGTVPGAQGSAVMDGHVDNGLSLPGVFKHLGDIKTGDDVYVDMGSGTLHFVVTGVEIYPYKEVPVETVFKQNDAARLNLITCEGTWVSGDKTYDHRLVIYTTLV